MCIRRGVIIVLNIESEPRNKHYVLPISPTERRGEFLSCVMNTFMLPIPIIDHDIDSVFDSNGEALCALDEE